MQEIVSNTKPQTILKIEELSPNDKQRLVDAFIWLIEEDKKQNPELYQPKNKKND